MGKTGPDVGRIRKKVNLPLMAGERRTRNVRRRRGGWITADDDHLGDLKNYTDEENSRLDWENNEQ